MTARSSRFYHRLQVAAHSLQKRADQALMQAAGISTAQAAVLSIVSAGDGPQQNTVAGQLGLNESAVTAMVNRLMALGLLSRARSARDARAWDLHVTDAGAAALANIQAPFAEINALIDNTFGPKDADRVAALLAVLSERLSEDQGRRDA